MIKLIEELYNNNEISVEVKNKLLDKHYNRETWLDLGNTGPCTSHANESDRLIEDEEALEERMKIIGQNGNTGEHYTALAKRTGYEDKEALRKEKEYYSKLRGDSSGTID